MSMNPKRIPEDVLARLTAEDAVWQYGVKPALPPTPPTLEEMAAHSDEIATRISLLLLLKR